MNLFYQPLIPDGANFLNAEESRHCTKVLRKRNGDLINLVDGKGKFYDAVLSKVDAGQCVFTITNERHEPSQNFFIHIAIAPTKNTDRMEWFAEKSTELGISKISFITCDHSERVNLKLDRIERIMVSAMKQSLKATLPKVNPLVSFKDFISTRQEDQKFIAHVDSANPHHLKDLAKPATSYCVLIGPEGDFSDEELSLARNSEYIKVSLGKSRLRTETAALAACHTLNLLNL